MSLLFKVPCCGVKIIIWTHKIDGLSESDFILAAKISAIGKTAA